MSLFRSKTLHIGCFLVAVIAFFAFSLPQDDKPKNLKVLPKNISHEELDKIMDGFCSSLGFECGDCHVKAANNPDELDFVSDENPQKKIARNMMKMTNGLNKKYFKDDSGKAVEVITCYTCHKGAAHPEEQKK